MGTESATAVAATASAVEVPLAVRQLVDSSAIAQMLADTIIQEKALEEELEVLLSRRDTLYASVKTLETGSDVLEVTLVFPS